MKTSKCLMGILLSSVLLIGSVFAGNALSQDVKDGILKKGQISVYNEIRSVGEYNENINRDCTDCEFDFTPYGSECCDSAWDEFGIDCMTLEANYNWDCSGCLWMVRQFVETDSVQVMKPMKHVHQIAMHLVNVMLVKYLTVTVAMNAGPKAGLVMVLLIVKIKPMALT